jgi:hypothetical protein
VTAGKFVKVVAGINIPRNQCKISDQLVRKLDKKQHRRKTYKFMDFFKPAAAKISSYESSRL